MKTPRSVHTHTRMHIHTHQAWDSPKVTWVYYVILRALVEWGGGGLDGSLCTSHTHKEGERNRENMAKTAVG